MTQKSPDMAHSMASTIEDASTDEHARRPRHSTNGDEDPLTAEEMKRSGACLSCCIVQ